MSNPVLAFTPNLTSNTLVTEEEERQLALCEAHIRHPYARYIEVIKFLPERWDDIYEQVKFDWAAYDRVDMPAPHSLTGRNNVRISQGDWIVLNDAPRRCEIIGVVPASVLP